MGYDFKNSGFEAEDPATMRLITYTYDSDSRLILKTNEYVNKRIEHHYQYDDQGRMIEVFAIFGSINPIDDSFAPSKTVRCSFEALCVKTTIIDTPLAQCMDGIPVHRYVFPYENVLREKPHLYNTSGVFQFIFGSSARNFLGIPWY